MKITDFFHVCCLMSLCRIENLEQSNEGVYICRASSVYGQAQDTARLTIQGRFQCQKYSPNEVTLGVFFTFFITFKFHFFFFFHLSPAKGHDQRANIGADRHDRELRGV